MVATSTLNRNSEFFSEFTDRGCNQTCIDYEIDFWEWCLVDPYLGADVCEEQTCQQLARLLEGCLSRAKASKLQCAHVLVPETLTWRVARDMLRLAAGEPCGLRGCVLDVHLELEEQQRCCERLERLACDASVVPTFELTLVFKQDGSGWPSLRDFCALVRVSHLAPTVHLSSALGLGSLRKTVLSSCEYS